MASTDIPLIESTSVEPLKVTLEADTDPTATTPEFGVTAVDAADPSGVWEAGSWISTWAAQTGWVSAHSATLGAAGADPPVAGGSDYLLWIRYGAVIKPCRIFRVR